MTFYLRLEVPETLPPLARNHDYDAQVGNQVSPDDEVVHVLAAQCRALAATGNVHFYVGGFGDSNWRVDVRTDLVVALEQLPEVMAGLQHEGRGFQLNFFEQGVERYLTGMRRGTRVTLECTTTLMNWTPEPSVETVSLADAQRMFRELGEGFCRAADAVCPWLSKVSAFRRWREAAVSSAS